MIVKPQVFKNQLGRSMFKRPGVPSGEMQNFPPNADKTGGGAGFQQPGLPSQPSNGGMIRLDPREWDGTFNNGVPHPGIPPQQGGGGMIQLDPREWDGTFNKGVPRPGIPPQDGGFTQPGFPSQPPRDGAFNKPGFPGFPSQPSNGGMIRLDPREWDGTFNRGTELPQGEGKGYFKPENPLPQGEGAGYFKPGVRPGLPESGLGNVIKKPQTSFPNQKAPITRKPVPSGPRSVSGPDPRMNKFIQEAIAQGHSPKTVLAFLSGKVGKPVTKKK